MSEQAGHPSGPTSPYAGLEREQRWLIGAAPPGEGPVRSIHDRYLLGTRLRLRLAVTGHETARKLTQKVPLRRGSPPVVALTTIYLSADEYDALAVLPADELRKVRSRIRVGGRLVAVDRFEGPLAGLVLAEVELAPGEPRLEAPAFALAEVSDDERFAGGRLARAGAAEVAALLEERDRLAPRPARSSGRPWRTPSTGAAGSA